MVSDGTIVTVLGPGHSSLRQVELKEERRGEERREWSE
jgi:hypothetical protein